MTSVVKELEKEIVIQIFHRSGKGVTLTNDGAEFLTYARQVYQQYEFLQEKYLGGNVKRKFSVSSQHYSFAVKAFVEIVKHFNTYEYEFAVRETKTCDVIEDVSTQKSEISILYLSDFNRHVMQKLFQANNLEFHKLIDCGVYVYMWKGHLLAEREFIDFADLAKFPFINKQTERDTQGVGSFLGELAAVAEEDAVFISTSTGSTGVPTMSPFTKQDFDEFQDTDSLIFSVRALQCARQRMACISARIRFL